MVVGIPDAADRQTLSAQQRQVTGIVKDLTGEPIIGASVLEKAQQTV